jgi:DNA polymerase III subunit delta
MNINQSQLASQLKKNTKIFILSGDEPFFIQEARDLIKTKYTDYGYDYVEQLSIDNPKKWQDFNSMVSSSDLFSTQKILDIRNEKNKFDKTAQKQLTDYVDNINQDIIVIISCGKLTASQKRSKWLSKVANAGVLVSIWPLRPHELPKWINSRITRIGLRADRHSIDLLASFTEGNILATKQAIEKLQLLKIEDQKVTVEIMQSILSDMASFNVFDVTNYSLAGNSAKVIHAVDQLQKSGAEPTLLLWSISRELRSLYNIQHAIKHRKSVTPFTNKLWDKQKDLARTAIRRCSLQKITTLLEDAHHCDKMIKGLASGDPWLQLKKMALCLSQGK